MERIPSPQEALQLEGYRAQLILAMFTLQLLQQKKELEIEKERLKHEAQMDQLIPTMLNKKAIEREVENRTEGHEPFGLLWIDINFFKKLNDTLGHRVGDDVLRELGKLLQRERDALGGRVGGDEFIVIIDLVNLGGKRSEDHHEQISNAYSRIKSIETLLYERFSGIKELGVGLSIGKAYFDPNNPVSAEELLTLADESMFEEKPPGSR